MRAHVIVLVALAMSQICWAKDELAPSLAGKTISGIIDVIMGGIKASPHIIGGEEAKPHSYPHQVMVLGFTEDNRTAVCGGSLIAPQWVLTAAHCTGPQMHQVVLLGRHEITANETKSAQTIQVEKSIIYWDYRAFVNDIALLRLQRPATLNQYVQTIRLPSLASKRQVLEPGTPVVLIGWGRTSMEEPPKEDFSPRLRFLESHVMSRRACSNLIKRRLPSTAICPVVRQGKSAYCGDSGGPMIITESDKKPTIIGIASFVSLQRDSQNLLKVSTNVYTRVDHYLDWIAKHTNITLRQK